MERAFSLFAAILLIRFVALESLYQRGRRVGDEVRFPAGAALRLILGIGIPLGLYGAYRAMIVARETGEWWLPGICLLFVLFAVIGDPGEIRVKSQGIELRRLLGLRKKYIGWEGAAALHSSGLREILVVGTDGTNITHSQYHVGQDQFLNELKRHRVPVE